MPYSGRDPAARRCRAKSKRTGERCRQDSVPFTEADNGRGGLCKWHGGYSPAVFEKARKAAERFALGWHSPFEAVPSMFERRVRLERFYEAEQRYEVNRQKKLARKNGWDYEAMKRAEAKAREQAMKAVAQRQAERAAAERGKPPPTSHVTFGEVQYGGDSGYWDDGEDSGIPYSGE